MDKYKKGDIVKITNEGWGSGLHEFFSDGQRFGLTIKAKSVVGFDTTIYEVFQNDLKNYWNVPERYLAFDRSIESDPKTWRRNKPLFVKFGSESKEVARHFSHVDYKGVVYVYRNGCTSFTASKDDRGEACVYSWREATKEELK